MAGIDIIHILNIAILFFLIVTAVAIVRVRDLVTSTVLLGALSLLMASEYLVLGAPDVAITEAAVGAGVSTVLILMALFLVGDKEKKSNDKWFLFPIILVGIATAVLICATFDMPTFASQYTPSQIYVAPYYIQSAHDDTGVPNMVTAILASYRGYDTLGETFVIFTAAVSVLALLGRFKKKGE